jgi:hypothetical protein
MLKFLASQIMRTTLDLDGAVLRELKRLQKRDGKSLGPLDTDLLAQALAERKVSTARPEPFTWISRTMGAREDLADKDDVQAVLDRRAGAGDTTGGRP